MRIRLPVLSRQSPVPSLLVLNAVLLMLLALAILTTPVPNIQTSFDGATVDISADSAWVLLPGQCVNIKWALEGIQSLYVDGNGKIGYDEMAFCPAIDVDSTKFEITAENGESNTYVFTVRHLPVVTVSSLTLLALLLPFVIAFYYLVTMRLTEPILSNLSPFLVLVALLLVCLLLQTARPFSINDVLNALRNLFTGPSWHLIGWVLAGLVFIPLAFQSILQGLRKGYRADFVVIAAFFIFILLLYLPFGFDFIWEREEWVFQAFLEGRASKVGNEVVSRFWLLILYPLANLRDINPIVFHHLLHVVLATAKLALLYGIVRKMRVPPTYSFLFTMLAMVYPVNSLLMSSRSMLHAFSMSAILAAVFLTLLCLERPSRLRLLGILLALFFNVGSYENAYVIIMIAPILWCWHRPRWTSYHFNVTVIWYLIPAAKLIYLFVASNAGWKYYGANYLSTALEQERTVRENVGHFFSVIGEVYKQTFFRGWIEAFGSLAHDEWIVPTLAALFLITFVAVYLTQLSAEWWFPSKRQMLVVLLTGLLFILPSIAVLLWFEQYQDELWRLYIYVPIGAAAVVVSVLLLIVSRLKNRNLCWPVLAFVCLLLMFPTISRLYVQHASLVKSANAKAKVLWQIVEQVPYFDANARLVVATNMSDKAFEESGIGGFWTNTLDSAIYMLYQEGRPRVSFLCRFRDRCSGDDISHKESNLESVVDFSDIVFFRLYDDLRVVLQRELPTELGGRQNHTYNPGRLIDATASMPPRALTLLGDL